VNRAMPDWADALSLVLERVLVDPPQVIQGQPSTGEMSWSGSGGSSWGVWEMTPGIMSDVEYNETCIIIQGHGFVTRMLAGELVTQELQPGVVLTLRRRRNTVGGHDHTAQGVSLSGLRARDRVCVSKGDRRCLLHRRKHERLGHLRR